MGRARCKTCGIIINDVTGEMCGSCLRAQDILHMPCSQCGKLTPEEELNYGVCAMCYDLGSKTEQPEDSLNGHPYKEQRIINEQTGGEKGKKLARFDLLPYDELWEVAELYGRGAAKYADRNWEKGYDWSLSFASMMRHATQFWQGEYMDKENKCAHLASVVFHALALMYFHKHHKQLDDRPQTNEA